MEREIIFQRNVLDWLGTRNVYVCERERENRSDHSHTMDTSRLMDLFLHHLPEFFKRSEISSEDLIINDRSSLLEFSAKENYHFASTTNLSDHTEEHFIYDTDGCLLFMQTTQSNLSLFNISCDSLIFDEHSVVNTGWNPSIVKHATSSIDLRLRRNKSQYRSTMIFNEETFSARTQTLQRWQRMELLNTNA